MALSSRYRAVVLAGGPHDAVAAAMPGAPNKAFVPVGGIALVERTLIALRGSTSVGRIVVVAPPAAHGRPELRLADELRPDGTTMSASLRSGLGGLPPGELLLVCASDLPVLSAEAVDEFLALAERRRADLVYSCVAQDAHVARFPEIPHTWARLRSGRYCGGGCVALRPRALAALDVFLGRLGDARKNPLRLASIFGAATLVRYALGRLTIEDAERRASALLGLPVAAAVCAHPEIAVNVDRRSDLALAERLVASVPRSSA